MGEQVTFHVYSGPIKGKQVTFSRVFRTNGGTGNIPVYSGPTNGETGKMICLLPIHAVPPMGEQVTFTTTNG
jgi:hypothetical protein